MFVVLIVIFDWFLPLRCLPVLCDLVKNVYLIVGGFHIVLGTLLDLQGNITIILKILSQPNSRKVTPSKFLNDHVSIQKNFTDMNGVVSSNFVVWHALIFTRIFVLVEAFPKNISERIEVVIIVILVELLRLCLVLTGLESLVFIKHIVDFINQVFNVSLQIDALVLNQVRLQGYQIASFLLLILPFLFLLFLFL